MLASIVGVIVRRLVIRAVGLRLRFRFIRPLALTASSLPRRLRRPRDLPRAGRPSSSSSSELRLAGGLFGQQRLAVGDRDLVIVGVDFAKARKPCRLRRNQRRRPGATARRASPSPDRYCPSAAAWRRFRSQTPRCGSRVSPRPGFPPGARRRSAFCRPLHSLSGDGPRLAPSRANGRMLAPPLSCRGRSVRFCWNKGEGPKRGWRWGKAGHHAALFTRFRHRSTQCSLAAHGAAE